MILNCLNQRKLLGHNEFFLTLKKLFDDDKLPNKIIFSGQKGIGKCTLSYHLSNYIFSIKEKHPYDFENYTINENNKSYKLVSNNIHPNFFLISIKDDKKVIDISQVRDMISFCNKSSFDNSFKIIIIDNIEYLNSSSTNALLKVVEEPNEKIFFFLIHDSSKSIFKTLNSRCINFKVNLDKNLNQEILKLLINNNFYNDLDKDFKNYYFTPGNFINLYNFILSNKINIKNMKIENFLNQIIADSSFKKDIYIKRNLINFIELFFFKKFNNTDNRKDVYFLYKEFVNKFNNVKKFNLDIEPLLIEFRSKFING